MLANKSWRNVGAEGAHAQRNGSPVRYHHDRVAGVLISDLIQCRREPICDLPPSLAILKAVVKIAFAEPPGEDLHRDGCDLVVVLAFMHAHVQLFNTLNDAAWHVQNLGHICCRFLSPHQRRSIYRRNTSVGQQGRSSARLLMSEWRQRKSRASTRPNASDVSLALTVPHDEHSRRCVGDWGLFGHLRTHGHWVETVGTSYRIDDAQHDVVDVVILGRENGGNAMLQKPVSVSVGNDAAHDHRNVLKTGLPQSVDDAWDEFKVRPGKNRQTDNRDVLFHRGGDDLSRRQPDSLVDDLESGVARTNRDVLGSVAMSVEPRLADEESQSTAKFSTGLAHGLSCTSQRVADLLHADDSRNPGRRPVLTKDRT